MISIIFNNVGVVIAGECVRVARDCIEGAEERVINGEKVYKDCWSYKDAYKCTGHAVNNCQSLDESPDCYIEETSCKEKVGDWGVAQSRTYKCDIEKKYTRKEKRYKAPSFQKKNFKERKRVVCGESVKCIDGKCFNMMYPANDEVGAAAGMLGAFKEMEQEGLSCECKDGSDKCDVRDKICRVFNGELHKCLKVKGQWISYAVAAASIYMAWTGLPIGLTPGAGIGATGTKLGAMSTMDALKFAGTQLGKVGLASLAKVDCCAMDGMLAPLCGGKAAALHAKKQQKFCKMVGRYKKKKLKGIVVTTSYCCFNSQMSYELETQARDGNKNTNGTPLIDKPWGSAKNPDCSGFTIEELQKIDFSKIDFSFLTEKIKEEALWGKMGGVGKALEHTQNLLEGEIESIRMTTFEEAEAISKSEDVLDDIDEVKLFTKKLNEKHDDIATQKEPIGRDKTRDIGGEQSTEYEQKNYKNRDKKGL